MTDPIEPTPAAAAPTPAETIPAAAPTAAQPTAKPRRRWVTPALTIVAALAIGLVGGVLIGHSSASGSGSGANVARGQFGGAGQGGARGGTGTGGANGGGFAGGGFTSGTIVSIDGSSIVVKAQDGTTKTVTTSGDTKVTKTDDSTVKALKAGQTITVIGAADSSGDVTATSISEGAAQRGAFSRPGGTGGDATQGSGSGD